MNYRHAFHAGNFADVLKHTVLALVLTRLTAKPKPLRVIDTHAGIGLYRLDSPEAERTGEWRGGIGRLIGPGGIVPPPRIGTLLEPYLHAVRAANQGPELAIYPGSPALALALLRADDRLVAAELHPEDATSLRRNVGGDRRAKVLEMDGWQAIRSLLPPKERRGVILVDPPFEMPGEHERLVTGLGEGVRRFATGTYILWLPVKEPRQTASFKREVVRLRLDKLLWVEMQTQAPLGAEALAATALLIHNPPYGLEAQLVELLPFLVDRLATGAGAGWSLETVRP